MDLNIRNIEPSLIEALKIRAAKLKQTLRQTCIEALSDCLWDPTGPRVDQSGVAQGERNSEGRTGKVDVKLTVAGSNPAPTTIKARRLKPEQMRKLMKANPGKIEPMPSAGSGRIPHDPTCPCMMCKMARESKKKP